MPECKESVTCADDGCFASTLRHFSDTCLYLEYSASGREINEYAFHSSFCYHCMSGDYSKVFDGSHIKFSGPS